METQNFIGDKRQRSSRRLRHEAQVQVFLREKGGLEEIRRSLGLRPSQICDLLKVHPSAWSRWVGKGEKAPPHIYQMLEWYMEIQRLRGLKPPVMEGPAFVPTIAEEFVEPDLEDSSILPSSDAPYLTRRTFFLIWTASITLQFVVLGIIAYFLK